MALKLDELLKKAQEKGYGENYKGSLLTDKEEVLRPWQQESILYTDKNKLDTNLTQTLHKTYTKLDTNSTQTLHKLDTKKEETRHKPYTQPYTKLDTNSTQTLHKLDTNQGFLSLTGLQRIIVIFIFQQSKISRNRVTNGLSTVHIANMLKIPVGSVKTTIIRLEKKGFLKRVSSKEGRGGWSCYEIPNQLYSELLEIETRHKLDTNLTQTLHKLDTEPYTEPYTTAPSSSSIYINNTTTTELPEDWQKIDISGLESVGFSTHHLLQLYRTGITDIAIIQDSIYHFAYDLSHNQKGKEIKTNAIAYFMGTMKRVGVYTPPDNYESEQTRGMRIYLEQKKKQQEKQLAMENELIELSYNDWVKELSEEEKQSLIPETIANGKLEGAKLAALRSHFKKNIWPARSMIVLKKIEEVS